jgi:hypothetical protein
MPHQLSRSIVRQLSCPLSRFVKYSIKGCGIRDDCVTERDWENQSEVETIYDPNESGEQGVRRRLKGGRILVMPRVPTRVRYCYRIYKQHSDAHLWVSPAPLTGVDIDVHDHTSKGLRYHVETIGEVDISRREESENHIIWHDELGMLPNQGFVLYWSLALPRQKAKNGHPQPVETSKNADAKKT